MVERVTLQQGPDGEPVDQAEVGFEKRLMESELISSGQVTLREVLNRKGRDPVGLLDVPANFQVRDAGTSIAYIASFPEDQASFGGERFIEVLREAKPVRQGREKYQGKVGILGDWAMLKEDVRSKSKDYGDLHREHTASTWPLTRKLKEHFEEIGENHFSRFWDAINSGFNDGVARILEREFKRLISEEKAFASYGLDLLVSVNGMLPSAISFPAEIGFTDQRVGFAEFLKRRGLSMDSRLNSSDFFERSLSLLDSLGILQSEKLTTDFYNGLSDIERRELIRSVIARSEHKILVDEEGNAYRVGMWHNDSLSRIEKVDNNQIQIREGESYIRLAFEHDEETGFREPVLAERYLAPQEGEIAPVIVWEKDKATGKRKYFCGKISAELIEAFPDLFFERQDTYFGQMTVAAYSEYLKTKLPVELPLVKGGPRQDMLEGQMLAFVRLFAAAYLIRSPVINGLEASGKSDLATVV